MGKKILIIIDIILLIVTIIAYKIVYNMENNKTTYTEETTKFIEENTNPVFKIKKIVLWSSAYAVDNSDKELKDIDISQFTDIEIYIDNLSKHSELTGENTINSMYIDEIKIETDEMNRDVRFNYKNPYNCGKFVDLQNWQEDGILFKVINTNKKQIEANYDENIFYTDCSNPITLGYVNKNFMTHCEISGETGVISFDGSILSKITQDIKKLNSKISFNINIVNNFNEKFKCKVEINNDLTANNYAIDTGFLNREIIPQNNELFFLKQN